MHVAGDVRKRTEGKERGGGGDDTRQGQTARQHREPPQERERNLKGGELGSPKSSSMPDNAD